MKGFTVCNKLVKSPVYYWRQILFAFCRLLCKQSYRLQAKMSSNYSIHRQ